MLLLVHCLWLASYLQWLTIVLIGLPWYYPHYGNYAFPSLSYKYLGPLIIVFLILVYCYLMLCLWFRDICKEYLCNVKILIMMLSLGFFGLILSEVMFFITYFWSLFHTTCYSSGLFVDGLWLSDQCVLTFWNTIILCLCGLSLGYALVIRNCTLLYLILIPGIVLFSFMFLVLQVKEYMFLCYYLNESIYSCMFLIIIGLHLSHVMVGILLCYTYLCTSCYSRSVLMFLWYQLRVTSHHLYTQILLVYWHLVELLWLIISLVLYL